ncbi:MAG: hypothetical protein R3281_13750 [Balneolaceae bacterium]|nr:hypothetical protein [Balneolaceae bacterium]
MPGYCRLRDRSAGLGPSPKEFAKISSLRAAGKMFFTLFPPRYHSSRLWWPEHE